jgi:hypothetical protein
MVMDYCENTFGVAPCTATGTKCFNTFYTCTDQANFGITTKTYQFINANLPLNVITDFYGYKPYIKQVDSLASEIKDGETIVKRLKAQFYDEDGDDFGVDPYLTDRTSVQGSFWKKFIARNKNYKGRLIKLYEGFDDVAAGSFELKFVGKIDNIQINKGIVTVEAVDLLRGLKDIKYPVATGINLAEVLGNIYSCGSGTAMLALPAQRYDYAERTDFIALAFSGATSVHNASGTLTEGSTYYFVIINYDAYWRPLARDYINCQVLAAQDPVHNAIDLTWTNTAGTAYTRVFLGGLFTTETYWEFTTEEAYSVISPTGTDGIIPNAAQRYYQLTTDDPTDGANWDDVLSIDVDVNDASELPAAGYIMVDKESMYYSSITSNTLNNLSRALIGSTVGRHEINTAVLRFLHYDADNPFTILDDILTVIAGIDAAYVDAKFATYETAWTDINVSARPILKASNLADVYFDLVNLVNCLSWVGDDGKIKIVKHTENPATYTELTDEANIVFDTPKVDFNQGSRFTRWGLYWNRIDGTKDIKESESYNHFNIRVNADAESEAGYNESKEDIRYTVWLNDDTDVVADINTYIAALLTDRETRTKQAQEVITLEVELKDGTILTGDVIKLTTSQLQDENGVDYTAVQFRVMKKEPANNKIKLKLQRRFS